VACRNVRWKITCKGFPAQPTLIAPAAIVQQRWQNLFGDDVPIVETTSTEAEEQREHEIERFEFEQKFNAKANPVQ